MSIMSDFAQWWASYKVKRKHKKQEELERMSCQTINVIEFDGELWVSYNDVPIVQVGCLNEAVEKVIASSRKGYLAWKIKYNVRNGI